MKNDKKLPKLEWKVEKRKLSELKLWEGNPRKITDKGFSKLGNDLEAVGDFSVLAIDTDGTVVSGNQRMRKKLENGEEYVDVKVPNRKLTKAEIKRIGLIGNVSRGEWDMDRLANEFEEELLKDMGFDSLVFDPETSEDIDLPEGEKEGMQQMTFTFSDEQAETVKRAMLTAAGMGDYGETGNKNKNGNALARVCEMFITQNGDQEE